MSTNTRSLFQRIAESIVGEVTWRTPDEGYCTCPGRELHTGYNGKRDCIVRVSGAPTIYCVHSSCSALVEEKNRLLRSAIGRAEWQIKRDEDPTLPEVRPVTRGELLRRARQRKLEDLAARAKRGLPIILSDYRWSVDQISAGSPELVHHDWRQVLQLFAPTDVVWIGDKKDSGHPQFADRFRSAREWLQGGACPTGPLMSAAVWKPGAFQRNAEHIRRSPFLVVESDTLTREQIGAVFRWCREGDSRDCLTLRAVIDTGGKGLHGWFDRPTSARALERWRVTLAALGCDEGPMRPASMSRLPGARRDNGRQQRLLWIDPGSEGVRPSFTSTHARARPLS